MSCLGRGQQGSFKDLLDVFNKDEVHLLSKVVWDLLKILLVLLREDDRFDSSPSSREDLFLNASNRQDLSAQGHLARQGDLMVDRLPFQKRENGCRNRDPGGGAILRGCPGWDVDMNIVFLIEIFWEVEGRDIRSRQPRNREPPRRCFEDELSKDPPRGS